MAKQKQLIGICNACGTTNILDSTHRAGVQIMKQGEFVSILWIITLLCVQIADEFGGKEGKDDKKKGKKSKGKDQPATETAVKEEPKKEEKEEEDAKEDDSPAINLSSEEIGK